ncbi:two-component system response regulator [Streptomyces sp. NPDC048219]|uniref:response regulator n=1 Tax=Streptomyces sp. NPDC048219 TaxID=3365517 RepID=UPI0037103D17
MEEPKVKILLVDNQPENLVALEAALSALDQTLVRASSGEEALKALDDDEFALVLLTTRMPSMDGLETAAQIKRRLRTRDTPIIFVSTHDIGAHATFRGYAAGAVDYVSRPYDPWALRAKVMVFVHLHKTNIKLRKQAALLRTGGANDLLGQMATLLSDAESQARDLTVQLKGQASSATVRTTATGLQRSVRIMRRVLQDALEVQEEPGSPPAPNHRRSP